MEFPDFPTWQQVAEFLTRHLQPDERVLAPDQFLNLFPAVYPLQIRRHWLDADFDWYVLHADALERVDRAVIRTMLAQAHPVFVNPAFFVFSRRTDLRRLSLQEPVFQQLQAYLMANGLIGAERRPPVRRAALVTTYQRPDMLEATLAALRPTGVELAVVDDGSNAELAARNRVIADAAGAAYLFVPHNRGLPTALNCGISYFLADERITWISSFNDDVVVDPAIYQMLGKIEATGKFPLMTGYLSPHHTVHETRVIDGVEVHLTRSMPGQHIHAARDYWRGVMPIPTPYLGAPKPSGGVFRGQGADEDWWIGSYSPRAVTKTGGLIAVVPSLVQNRGVESSTWAMPGMR